tara:strand:+ start:90 stop:275 length:186 start_codon:yes stop_codon:yes gene_type:complete
VNKFLIDSSVWYQARLVLTVGFVAAYFNEPDSFHNLLSNSQLIWIKLDKISELVWAVVYFE